MSLANYARHLCVGVDMQGYSSRNGRCQENTQSDLVKVLHKAAREASLDRGHWLTQPAGDGELSLLPLDGSEPRVLYHLVHELEHELASYNQDRMAGARMRLRMAIHQGVAYPAANGYAGDAVVAVSRLLDSEPLRSALEVAPRANLALILSAPVYDEVVRGGHTRYRPEDFRQVPVEVKDFTAEAWLWVPRHDIHSLPLGGTPAAPRGTEQRAAVGAGGTYQATRDVQLREEGAQRAAEYHFHEAVDGRQAIFGPNFGTVTRDGDG